IFLHAKWAMPFDKRQTVDEKFYRTSSDAIKVPMMHRTARLRYAKVDGALVVELPYAGGEFSMVVVLPDEHDRLADVEKRLPEWGQWTARLRECEVILAMPRMKLRQKYGLAGTTFPAMGMKIAFSGAGDFTGIRA